MVVGKLGRECLKRRAISCTQKERIGLLIQIVRVCLEAVLQDE